MADTIKKVRDAVVSVGVPTYHYFNPTPKGNFLTWAEDGWGDADFGDGQLDTAVIQGTVDYFTKNEYDATTEKIEDALSIADIPFQMESIQYEEDTGYVHYSWIWEVI